MTTIIAGGFDNIVPAEEGIRRLREAGVSDPNICKWRVNPPGMHARHPTGGVAAGAWQVEEAEGSWVDGEWADFDPVSSPHLIGGRDARTEGTQQQTSRS